MEPIKTFTAAEANALIPELSACLRELQKRRDEIAKIEVEIDALELVAQPTQEAGSPALERRIADYEQAVERFYALIDKVHAYGCFLKDVDMGLVDFYSLREGRVVYLCWKLGEKQVGFWHEVGLGYTQRQPLGGEGS
jgi:hypothetical protein